MSHRKLVTTSVSPIRRVGRKKFRVRGHLFLLYRFELLLKSAGTPVQRLLNQTYAADEALLPSTLSKWSADNTNHTICERLLPPDER